MMTVLVMQGRTAPIVKVIVVAAHPLFVRVTENAPAAAHAPKTPASMLALALPVVIMLQTMRFVTMVTFVMEQKLAILPMVARVVHLLTVTME